MKLFYRNLLDIINCALYGDIPENAININPDSYAGFAFEHQINSLVYEGFQKAIGADETAKSEVLCQNSISAFQLSEYSFTILKYCLTHLKKTE